MVLEQDEPLHVGHSLQFLGDGLVRVDQRLQTLDQARIREVALQGDATQLVHLGVRPLAEPLGIGLEALEDAGPASGGQGLASEPQAIENQAREGVPAASPVGV